MQTFRGLGYVELRTILRTSHIGRERRRHSKKIHRSLVEACVEFTKRGFRIVDVGVIDRLRVAFRELGIANRRARFLVEGEIKSLELRMRLNKRKVFAWVPRLEAWLRDQAYKLWLGTLQTSLESDAYLTEGTCRTNVFAKA